VALTLTTLTGTIVQPDDSTPCHGSIVLTPGSGLLVAADDNRLLAGELTIALDANGAFTVDLPSTDNEGVQPEPGTWNWSVRFKLLDAAIPEFSFALPSEPDSVDLADVARVAPAPGTYLVVPGPAGPQGEKGDPGDVGAGALLAANNLADLTDATAARASLGLGTAATQASSAFDAAGSAATAQSAAVASAASDATTKAGTAQANAISAAAGDATAKVAAHTAAIDPHGDRAAAAADATTKAAAAQSAAATDATSKVTAHTGAVDPHGDRAAAASALSGHVAASDPHGDRAAAAADATTKANTAQSAATSAAATDAATRVTAHSGAADPHGDRVAAATDAATKVSAHAGASDPHGDRAFATSAVTTHTGAADPHGDRAAAATDASSKVAAHTAATDPHADRAFTTSAISTHAAAADPHGDRADAATKYLPMTGGALTGNLTVAGHALRTPQAADHGLRAWTFDPRFCGATAAVAVGGTLFLSGMFITESFTATTLYWGVSVAPSGQTAGQNFVGLYDSTGTLLTSFGVDSDTATTGLKTAAISVALTPGTYWAAFLFNASTTAPQLPRAAGAGGTPTLINVGLSGASQLYASNGTGRTAMPSTITMSSNVAATGYWAAIK
jgi:hypothetical protein